jgi:hypothetical protein
MLAFEGAENAKVDKTLAIYRGLRRGAVAKQVPSSVWALRHPRILERFIEAGANVNETNSIGKTPLMVAAHFNLLEAAKILLAIGANPNMRLADPNTNQRVLIQCPFGISIGARTALMYAAENSSLDMISLLIEHGADVSARDSRARRDVLSYLARSKDVLSATEYEAALNLIRGAQSRK